MSSPEITVVGIGADGWPGLADAAREAVRGAEVLLGSPRQLDLVDRSVPAARVTWPSPLLPALPALLAEHRDRRLTILASGDPLFFGIGASVLRCAGDVPVRVLPHASSVSLACARMGWALEEVEVLSLVGRPRATLHPAIQPGRRVLALVSDPDAGAAVTALLRDRGFGASAVWVLEQLGGPREQIRPVTDGDPGHDRLAVLAIACVADPATVPLPRTPGLPDEAFATDGQLTKREVRAVTLAALVPVPGQLLWDVGAGSGSVGIEWMRTHPACRAVAVEARADRCARIRDNAAALGVPALQVLTGQAPEALCGLPVPDAVFVGGAVSAPGVIEACLAVLPPGGRLVANAVTVQAESVLADWYARRGGTLTRVAVQRAEPIGGFTGWRPAMPVTQWSYRQGPR